MKANLIEMLKAQGFSEVESKSETIQQCNGVILQRDWSREVEVAFHGSYLETYAVRVFVNRNSGICHVSYQKDGREYAGVRSSTARTSRTNSGALSSMAMVRVCAVSAMMRRFSSRMA